MTRLAWAVVALLVALVVASACDNSRVGDPTAPTRVLDADPPPAGVSVSVTAVDVGGRSVRAIADVRGAVAVQFEWYFERGPMPEVVTTTSQASYSYERPGFKDFTVRITLTDGRRVLASGAVIVE